jgi:ribosomal protein S18 acetylase RimI-like enzyme
VEASTENDAITYTVYTPADAEEMTRLLADVFPRHDPPAYAVGMTSGEFATFVRTLLPRAAEERLTIVARLAQSGEMVGAALANDPACESGPSIETLGKKFAMVGSILGELVTKYRAGKEPPPGEQLHLYLLGVSDRAAGLGVAQRLVAECLENGTRRRYKVAIAEATNRVSQHIFRKLGFSERAQVPYCDHLFDGERVFESIAGEGGPILMEKLLA